MRILLSFIIVSLFTMDLSARCNKSALQQLTKIRKQLCKADKNSENCHASDKDMKRYLTSFASNNNEDCDRLHKVYAAPDKPIEESHKLNIKKK